jgi:transketolase
MRRAFADTLMGLARADERIIFLTGDLGYGVFDDFIEEFGPRYVNAGVAEAQLVDCAAGLALEGWRPIVYSIASFMTGRAFEQIRLAVGYHGLPVVVVGAGGGYTYASSGVTHHAVEDFGLMSIIPGMTVIGPGGPTEVKELFPQLFQLDGPSYIRIGRFGEPDFAMDTQAKIGVGRVIQRGEHVCIATTAGQVIDAIAATKDLSADGMNLTHLHFPTITPFDSALLARETENIDTILVVEEHAPIGGLGSQVQQWAAAAKNRPAVRLMGAGTDLLLGNPNQTDARRWRGFDSNAIVEAVKQSI